MRLTTLYRRTAPPAILAAALLAAAAANAQDFSFVPGDVVHYINSPLQVNGSYPQSVRFFFSSPSITVAPNGDYFASHDVFGDGTDTTLFPDTPYPSTTFVFRSTDQGVTWQQTARIAPNVTPNYGSAVGSTIFSFNNALYLFGNDTSANGGIVIRKSTNNGVTWTVPTSSSTGLIQANAGQYITANTPVIDNGRIWLAVGGRSAISADVNLNLLLADSWVRTDSSNVSTNPWGAPNGDITEAQIVASPLNGVTVMPKVDGFDGSGTLRILSTTAIADATTSDWIDMPGGEKKFAVQYDSVSGKFYSLSNPILAAHINDPVLESNPGLIRNTAALMSSKDQKHWDVEKIFLYSANIDRDLGPLDIGEAFQYMNFTFDGDDMAVVSRTAFEPDLDRNQDVGQHVPDKGHNSNFITFHRIENFRSAAPTQVLVADSLHNRVLRYEANGGLHLAPLGAFNLGSTFAGAALTKPMGVAQTANGDVYVNEAIDTAGRILRFDASGNFLEVIATGGTNFTGRPEAMTIGPDGNLYMSVAFGSSSDKIYKIDLATKVVTTFVDTNFGSGTLNNPRGIAFGSDGHLCVADSTSGQIRKFNGSTGAFISNVVTTTSPLGLVWDPIKSKFLFTAQVGSDLDVYEVTLDGSVTKIYDPNDVGTGFGLADVNGEVFWTDANNDKINLLFTPPGGSTSTRLNSVGTFPSHDLDSPGYMTPTAIVQPAVGERSWIKTGAGDWEDLVNWYYWGRPDTNYEVANLGSAIAANTTLTMNGNYKFKGLRFRNANSYLVDGPGEIILQADTGHAVLDVQQGIHRIANPVTLYSDTDWTVAAGTRLFFQDTLNLNGQTLTVTGPGQRNIDGAFVMLGGKLVTDGRNQITFTATTQATLNGTLEFVPYVGASLALGAAHDLFNGIDLIADLFDAVLLPELGGGLQWDTSALYVTGSVSVAGVLGDYNLDGLVDAADYTVWRNTLGSTTNWAADGNRNEIIDEGDYAVWKTNFGNTAPASGQASSAVPEPSALALAALAIVAAASRRRGRVRMSYQPVDVGDR